MELNPQILEKDGKKEFVVLPYEKFLELQDELENYDDLHYHVCGGPIHTSATENWINDFVSKSKFRDRFHLYGQVEDVYPYCANADIFFSATEKELLPMSHSRSRLLRILRYRLYQLSQLLLMRFVDHQIDQLHSIAKSI